MSMSLKRLYPDAKAIQWNQCERIFNHNLVIFVQYGNLGTNAMASLRQELRNHRLRMAFPKPSIMRAFMRQKSMNMDQLIVGPTFCAYSQADPDAFVSGLDALANQNRVLVVGGYAFGRAWSLEGLKSLRELRNREHVGRSLLQCLNSGIDQAVVGPSLHLVQCLEMHAEMLGKSVSE